MPCCVQAHNELLSLDPEKSNENPVVEVLFVVKDASAARIHATRRAILAQRDAFVGNDLEPKMAPESQAKARVRKVAAARVKTGATDDDYQCLRMRQPVPTPRIKPSRKFSYSSQAIHEGGEDENHGNEDKQATQSPRMGVDETTAEQPLESSPQVVVEPERQLQSAERALFSESSPPVTSIESHVEGVSKPVVENGDESNAEMEEADANEEGEVIARRSRFVKLTLTQLEEEANTRYPNVRKLFFDRSNGDQWFQPNQLKPKWKKIELVEALVSSEPYAGTASEGLSKATAGRQVSSSADASDSENEDACFSEISDMGPCSQGSRVHFDDDSVGAKGGESMKVCDDATDGNPDLNGPIGEAIPHQQSTSAQRKRRGFQSKAGISREIKRTAASRKVAQRQREKHEKRERKARLSKCAKGESESEEEVDFFDFPLDDRDDNAITFSTGKGRETQPCKSDKATVASKQRTEKRKKARSPTRKKSTPEKSSARRRRKRTPAHAASTKHTSPVLDRTSSVPTPKDSTFESESENHVDKRGNVMKQQPSNKETSDSADEVPNPTRFEVYEDPPTSKQQGALRRARPRVSTAVVTDPPKSRGPNQRNANDAQQDGSKHKKNAPSQTQRLSMPHVEAHTENKDGGRGFTGTESDVGAVSSPERLVRRSSRRSTVVQSYFENSQDSIADSIAEMLDAQASENDADTNGVEDSGDENHRKDRPSASKSPSPLGAMSKPGDVSVMGVVNDGDSYGAVAENDDELSLGITSSIDSEEEQEEIAKKAQRMIEDYVSSSQERKRQKRAARETQRRGAEEKFAELIRDPKTNLSLSDCQLIVGYCSAFASMDSRTLGRTKKKLLPAIKRVAARQRRDAVNSIVESESMEHDEEGRDDYRVYSHHRGHRTAESSTKHSRGRRLRVEEVKGENEKILRATTGGGDAGGGRRKHSERGYGNSNAAGDGGGDELTNEDVDEFSDAIRRLSFRGTSSKNSKPRNHINLDFRRCPGNSSRTYDGVRGIIKDDDESSDNSSINAEEEDECEVHYLSSTQIINGNSKGTREQLQIATDRANARTCQRLAKAQAQVSEALNANQKAKRKHAEALYEVLIDEGNKCKKAARSKLNQLLSAVETIQNGVMQSASEFEELTRQHAEKIKQRQEHAKCHIDAIVALEGQVERSSKAHSQEIAQGKERKHGYVKKLNALAKKEKNDKAKTKQAMSRGIRQVMEQFTATNQLNYDDGDL